MARAHQDDYDVWTKADDGRDPDRHAAGLDIGGTWLPSSGSPAPATGGR